jgi:hypothetical protein
MPILLKVAGVLTLNSYWHKGFTKPLEAKKSFKCRIYSHLRVSESCLG